MGAGSPLPIGCQCPYRCWDPPLPPMGDTAPLTAPQVAHPGVNSAHGHKEHPWVLGTPS